MPEQSLTVARQPPSRGPKTRLPKRWLGTSRKRIEQSWRNGVYQFVESASSQLLYPAPSWGSDGGCVEVVCATPQNAQRRATGGIAARGIQSRAGSAGVRTHSADQVIRPCDAVRRFLRARQMRSGMRHTSMPRNNRSRSMTGSHSCDELQSVCVCVCVRVCVCLALI